MMAPLFPQRILNISSAVNVNWCQWMWRHWEGESPCVTFSETSATPHSEPEQLKYFLICLHIDILEDDPDFYKNSQHLKLRLVGKGRVWVRGGIPMELEEEEKMGVGGGTMSWAGLQSPVGNGGWRCSGAEQPTQDLDLASSCTWAPPG